MCLITCNSIHAQKIVKDEIDEFTGNRITETNYISFSDGFTCALHKVNNTIRTSGDSSIKAAISF